MTEREPFPERQGRDHARTILVGTVSAVPWIGGPGAELLNFYLPSALENRRDRWFKQLDEKLEGIEDRVLNDEMFQTLVLEATKAALGTHLEEKLQLLAEAVRSSAGIVHRGDDAFIAMRLLRWVDELEPIHFEILGILYDTQLGARNVPWRDVLDRVPIEDDAWYQALDDLTSRRLVRSTGYNPDIAVADAPPELIWIERLGAQLVEFVNLMTTDDLP